MLRWFKGLLVVGVLAALMPLTTQAAQASTGGLDKYDKVCDASSPPAHPAPPRKIIHLFDKPHGGKVPLRCGRLDPTRKDPCNGWGYRHIRCKHWFNWLNPGYVQTTLMHPDSTRRHGDYITLQHWFTKRVWYRVVWSHEVTYPGSNHPQLGIVTAFMKGL